MENINTGKFFRQTLAQSIGGCGIKPAGIGDVSDDTAFADPVGSPTDGTDIAVVNAFVQNGG